MLRTVLSDRPCLIVKYINCCCIMWYCCHLLQELHVVLNQRDLQHFERIDHSCEIFHAIMNIDLDWWQVSFIVVKLYYFLKNDDGTIYNIFSPTIFCDTKPRCVLTCSMLSPSSRMSYPSYDGLVLICPRRESAYGARSELFCLRVLCYTVTARKYIDVQILMKTLSVLCSDNEI